MTPLRHILTAIVVLTGLTIASCGSDGRTYSNWAHLPAEGWAYGDTITLVPIDTTLHDNDSTLRAPLRLGVAHSNSFPYSNLWLEVTYRSDRYIYRDTIDLELADVYGRWLGKGFGTGLQHEVTLTPRADIDVRMPVSVRHIMRVDTLRGVDMIGVSIR
ncbi:MAG: gliding motility lipoprotein GldH [Duncaniella sp.]|nr:gliding motility lipoprotein GldH [Duncaniella sp.]